MTALLHRHHDTPAPTPVCGSDALFRVEGTGTYLYCGPHLHMGLTDHLAEGTVIYDAEPGRTCEWTGGAS